MNLSGEGAEWLRAPPQQDAQRAAAHRRHHLCTTACPDEQHIAVDCLGFRQGKDARLQKVASSSPRRQSKPTPPQINEPLDPYKHPHHAHMAVAERGDAALESIGDAFMKTVIIFGE